MTSPQRDLAAGVAAIFLCASVFAITASSQTQQPPPSLKTLPVPEPPNLSEFVKDRAAAIRLGKALFWDMQVSSDAVVACATCH